MKKDYYNEKTLKKRKEKKKLRIQISKTQAKKYYA